MMGSTLAIHYVGGATLSFGIDGPDREPHKRRIAYSITLPYVAGSENSFETGRIERASDLSVVARDTEAETLLSAYESLLSFLGAAGESRPGSENADLFPEDVTEWARQYSDEIASEALELEEAREDLGWSDN